MDLDDDVPSESDVRPFTGANIRPVTRQSRNDPSEDVPPMSSGDRLLTGMNRPSTGMNRPPTQLSRIQGSVGFSELTDERDEIRPITGYGDPGGFGRPSTGGIGSRPQTSGRILTRPATRGSNIAADPDEDFMNSVINDTRPSTSRGQSGRFRSGMRRSDEFQGNLEGLERPGTVGRGQMDRPTTSRGMGGVRPGTRQGTSVGQRPVTGQNSARLGTATRLTTAMLQRTATASGQNSGIVTAQVNVVDRPITQQGLGGLKTAGKTGRGPNRQVQDKSYFMGLLRTKTNELQSEITKMSKEIDDFSKEQSTYLIYDKRVKELAGEWNELQGELADYNLLVDKLNMDSEIEEIQSEVNDLKAQNNAEAAAVDEIFAEKQNKEKIIRALEAEIEQERNLADNLIGSMDPRAREQYSSLQAANSSFLARFDTLQQELDALNARKAQVEGELSMSHVKQDVVKLYEQLAEAEEDLRRVTAENDARGTPAQERERLLRQVKDDNAEIAAMDRQASALSEEIRSIKDEISQLDADIEESQSERSHKYRELRKREETMDQFLENFDTSKLEEAAKLGKLEASVVQLLERLARAMAMVDRLPNPKDFSDMKDDLAFKEGELRKSRSTVEGLAQEKAQLQSNLEKIEALEEKVTTEMAQLKEKRQAMIDEMAVYSRPEVLKRDAEDKENELSQELADLEKEYKASSLAVKELHAEHERLKKSLEENETYAQLRNLERKWGNLEQNNYAVRSAIRVKQAEANVGAIKAKVFSALKEYNKILQEAMTRGGI
ncbi:unnamed protein product [Notodromas monacha]|uniref:Intraflagellar transport protein 74 n=1 Tax=Notodromas monacha TaxID=399045 RepID=A0A7R9BF84_9CRUS|nr:unnamed protein product [Notodromas monacha]CAG0914290.1 unnamed protein product [Notodromas monacha]